MTVSETRKAVIPWLIVVGLWAILHGVLAATISSAIFHGQLPGPDEYMRLVRVSELYDGGGWYDGTIDRSNAPYGDTLHWTRPLDVLILAGVAILSPFMSAHDALFVTGAVLPPIFGLVACFAVAWAAFPVLGRDRAIFAALMLLIQPAVLAYTVPGRADHHALLFVLSALVTGGAIRTMSGRPTTGAAIAAGAAYGVAIWTSVEMTLLVALCQGAAVVSWVRFPRVSARPQVIAAFTFVAAMLMAHVLEHAPQALMMVEYDRISLPYLAIAVLTAIVWSVAWMLERRSPETLVPYRRLTAIGIAGVAAAAVLLTLFPDLIAGPLGGADPRLEGIWQRRVAENHALMPTTLQQTGEFLFFIGTVAVAIPYAVVAGWRHRTDPRCMPWFFIAAVCTVYFLLALTRFRLAPYAELASTLALADMIARVIGWSERHLDKVRCLLVYGTASFALMFGGALSGLYIMTLSAKASNGQTNPKCGISEIAPLLNDPNGLGARPLVIAALLDRGPEILYRTRHSVVSTPYHRNSAGIWDTYRIFASPDEAESRTIIARRGVDLLLLCPSSAERRFFDRKTAGSNLYSHLLDGKTPNWLAPVAIDSNAASGFRLFRVLR
jgi:hypothetical protein